MTSLRDIRSRLRSIENIKKITDAMEQVAAARLRRAQLKAEKSRPYISKMKEILENLAATEYSHPLFEQREVKKTALVILSAEKGLSGSYNSNIIMAADSFLKDYTPEAIDLLLFGRKAIGHYKNKKWPIRYERADWGGKISFHEIKIFVNRLIHEFSNGHYDEVWLIHTHYLTLMNRKVIVEKFLNIGKPKIERKSAYLNYIFEPSPEEIFSQLIPEYCATRIQTAFYEAYASELAARVFAMQTASKNSKDLINTLKLVRNRVRQESITKEMLEISSGAER